MTSRGHENRTLAECALASARLFEAQQWKWRDLHCSPADVNDPNRLHVPDAERILQMLEGLLWSAMDTAASGNGARSSSGRLRVEVCDDECARTCEKRCVQIWQQLGELELPS